MPFTGKTLLITGGTGTFGNAVLHRFLQTDIAEIRIFSRDEKMQHDMRLDYNNPSSRRRSARPLSLQNCPKTRQLHKHDPLA